jgi:hypothetical protein
MFLPDNMTYGISGVIIQNIREMLVLCDNLNDFLNKQVILELREQNSGIPGFGENKGI